MIATGPGGPPPDFGAVREAAWPLIALALAEDLGERGDVTSLATIVPDVAVAAHLVARAEGVLAGLDVARTVLMAVDGAAGFSAEARDGDRLSPGMIVATVTGSARSLLSAERTMLNFVQRLSGVASQVARYVAAIEGTGVRVLDTRKTTPGWRVLEKYAVAIGGGVNHRMGLFDLILIKDNHAMAAGGVGPAVAAALASRPEGVRIEVEVRTLADIDAALAYPVDGLLFDNMNPASIDAAVARVARLVAGRPASRPFIEVSGGITLATIRNHARPGVDFISVGAITHSAPALDLALDIVEDQG
ncbi:MAG TPA: carboxylating nicotinate-nucleotide diphosphorylase [Candidatus Eisenbacteria bacterium]